MDGARTTPEFYKDSFCCPHCMVVSLQRRSPLYANFAQGIELIPNYMVIACDNCRDISLWRDRNLVYPQKSLAPDPTGDMPIKVKECYEEARGVCNQSSRAAAALLRLSIQHLCIELGCKGKNINDDIGELVSNGMKQPIKQALDVLRVVGNNCVHPGRMSDEDTDDVVMKLFKLVNIIVEDQITNPRSIQALYDQLPASSKKQIAERDK